jgi:penicillin-binding protein A
LAEFSGLQYQRLMHRFFVPQKQLLALAAFIAAALLIGAAAAQARQHLIKYSTISWKNGHASAQTEEGRSVELGLDFTSQHHLEQALLNAKAIAGAATLVDAKSGQILAAVEVGDEPRGSLLFDPVAPAASVFKLVTTVALFEKTEVTPLTRVCTQGGLRGIELEHLSPAAGTGIECSKFAHALGTSKNAVYAQLATQHLMRADLQNIAQALGFGHAVDLDVRAQVGLLDVPYNDLDFARTAAGFENSRLSAMGAAQLALTIARGGLQTRMHFTAHTMTDESVRVMSSKTARRLRDAMEVTIHSGTARSSFVDGQGRSTVGPVQVAGKTGTLREQAHGPTTSWFVGFAPSEDPQVVVSIVLQNPTKWHQRGHEVAREVLRAYLSRRGVAVPSAPSAP